VPKIAKDRIEENQRRIEAAALNLFTKQGFHGTNIREIAEKIGVSTGTIYTYYPSKEAIFESLVRGYRSRVDAWRRQACAKLKNPLAPDDLTALAAEIRTLLAGDPEYMLLLYIDVVEFQNQHFAETFRDVPEQFRRLLGPALRKTGRQSDWRGEDPALVLASVYLYFFTHAGIETLYQSKRHLGVPDDQAAERFAHLLSRGLWSSTANAGSRARATEKLTKRQIEALHQPARDQINLMRLLSGRLWIYTYYPSKEALFESLVKNYRSSMRGFRERVFRALEDPFSKSDLRLLAAAVRSMVYHDAEYQLLTFIDIIEFRNQHFADTFYKMPEPFRRHLGPALKKVKRQKGWCGEDPAFALAAIYLYFFTYFVVERLMHQGNQHLGVSDEEVIERFIDLLSHGMWSEASEATAHSAPRQKIKIHVRDVMAQGRSEQPALSMASSRNGVTK
jgi:AcrR family transcriptional regulator